MFVASVGVACGPRSTRSTATTDRGPALQFAITDGEVHNHFVRGGSVAAHVILRPGTEPRLLVAFPAGNAGIAVWFKADAPQPLRLIGELEVVERQGGMRGVTGRLEAGAVPLRLGPAVLGSIRTIRDFIALGTAPAQTRPAAEPGPPLALRRTTACGTHMEIVLAGLDGTRVTATPDGVRIDPPAGGRARLAFTAVQDEAPLTALAPDELLGRNAVDSPAELRALAFLSYREKLLAGSWRFLTYFGRDTLLSTRLLLPALRPETTEAAIGSVLERLAPDGDVAHEEDIGEFAGLRRAASPALPGQGCEPIYDYKMIDDDFLLAPVLVAYLETPAGRERAAAFLARTTSSGTTFAKAVARNLALVLARAEAWVRDKTPTSLVALKAGQDVGEWRDSREGLGGGRYAFNVNASLVPAALEAAEKLYASHLGDAPAAARARALAVAWRGVERAFRVEIPAADAKARVAAYARAQGLDPAPAVAAIDGPIVFPALSLDAAGKPIAIMHSDDGFVLLFNQPSPEVLDDVAGRLLRPFPAGLMSPVGVLVANPAFAPAALQATFTRDHYHGAVVWSWQQAMLLAGLERQLGRRDLPERTRQRLVAARGAVWDAVRRTGAQRTGELWSWEPAHGKMQLVPFGQRAGHKDESNAAQLWSTVYLGIPEP